YIRFQFRVFHPESGAWNDVAPHHFQEFAEPMIVCGICDGKMKDEIRIRCLPACLCAGFHLPQTEEKLLFVRRRASLCCEARRLDFDSRAKLQKLQDCGYLLIIYILEGLTA